MKTVIERNRKGPRCSAQAGETRWAHLKLQSSRWNGARKLGYAFAMAAMLISNTAISQHGIARYNTNGSRDVTFDGDGRVSTSLFSGDGSFSGGSDVAVQPDGRIIMAGTTRAASFYRFVVARFLLNGGLDWAVTVGFTDVVSSYTNAIASTVVIQSDGKIVVGGRAYSSSDEVFALVRLNADGTLDRTFNRTGKVLTNFITTIGSRHSEELRDLAIQSDGKIVAAGAFTRYPNTGIYRAFSQFALARYNADGSLDATFGSGGKVTTGSSHPYSRVANAVIIHSNGKIFVAGGTGAVHHNDALNQSAFILGWYSSNGRFEGAVATDFPGTYEVANAMALQSDGKIVVAGKANGQFALARYSALGVLDSGFDGDGRVVTDFSSSNGEWAEAVALQANGKIVAAGGAFPEFNPQFALARYNTNGSLDATFDGDGKLYTDFDLRKGEVASAVAIAPNGKIVVAGYTGFQRIDKEAAPDGQNDQPIPKAYALEQNYPNPFNPTTTIQFDLHQAGFATLKIYNNLGQEVAVLVNETLAAGRHALPFDATGLPSGVYFYRLSINGFSEVKRMEVVK